jgi:hypothetical protein
LEISFRLRVMLVLLVFATYGGESRTQERRRSRGLLVCAVTPDKQAFPVLPLGLFHLSLYR